MLNGRKAFGDKVAREIERNAELPRYYLDGLSPWPFDTIEYEQIERLSADQMSQVEGAIRLMLAQFGVAHDRDEPLPRRPLKVGGGSPSGPGGRTSGEGIHEESRPRKSTGRRKK